MDYIEKRTGGLTALAVEINEHHDRCVGAANTALQHARQAGELLAEAKAECGHGNWLTWLAENFTGSTRTAQTYLRIAERWPEIEAKCEGTAHLSLDAAVRLLRSPKPVDLHQQLAEVENELREIDQQLDDPQAMVDQAITPEALEQFGRKGLCRELNQRLTRLLGRRQELTDWTEGVLQAANARLDELSRLPELNGTSTLSCVGTCGRLATIIPAEDGFFYVGIFDEHGSTSDEFPKGIIGDRVADALKFVDFAPAGEWQRAEVTDHHRQLVQDARQHAKQQWQTAN